MQLADLFANPWLRRVPATISLLLLLSLSGSKAQEKSVIPATKALARPTVRSRVLAPGVERLELDTALGIDLYPAAGGQALEVDLQSSEYRKIDFEQRGADLRIAVVAPSGKLLFEVDGPSGLWGTETVPLLGNPAGRYRLEITAVGHGTYLISSSRIRQARNSDRSCILAAGAYFRGKQLLEEDRLGEAERELLRSRRLWRSCGNALGEADAIHKIAQVRTKAGEWSQALSAFSGAWSIYRRLRLLRMQAMVLSERGALYETSLGRTKEALKAYEKVLKIPQEPKFMDVTVVTLNNRSKLRRRLGDLSGALQDAESARSLARSAGMIVEEVRAQNLVGDIYRLLGETETALRLHQQVWHFLRNRTDLVTERAATQVHLGDDYRALHRWNSSISSYLAGIRGWRELKKVEEEATALNNLSIVYSRTDRWNEARDALRRVLEIDKKLRDRAGEAVASVNLAWILSSLGHLDEARDLYSQALRVFHAQNLKPDQAVAYFGLAWIERRRGNLNEARRLLEKSLAIVENVRARAESRTLWVKFLADWQHFYSLQVEILMEMHEREPARGYDLQAFLASERARCRTLLESVEGGIVLPSPSLRELQGTLDKDTVLLEYFLGEESSFLWVMTVDGLKSYVLPGQATIETLAEGIYGLLPQSFDMKTWPRLIEQTQGLGQILLGPVVNRLTQKRILVVVPPELQYVPFGALTQLPPVVGAEGPWPVSLLDRFEVLSEPSATFLATLRRLRAGRQAAPELLALIGEPIPFPAQGRTDTGPGAAFPSLRYSQQEMEALERAARGRATEFIRSDATRDLVLSGRLTPFRMLHFSVHGLPSVKDPQESALVLSEVDRSGRKIECLLHAHEVARLDLPADLVTLGGCGTALGAKVRGEGLVGLTQAFFAAGASSIVASLLNVEDSRTSELMANFYRNMMEKGLPPSAALREAQLALKRQKQLSPPYYWAGFVLQGEWR